MSYKNDLFEGMGSIYDIKGERHFNNYNSYPSPNGVIRNTWHNVGCHLDNATMKLARQKGFSTNPFKRSCVFDNKI